MIGGAVPAAVAVAAAPAAAAAGTACGPGGGVAALVAVGLASSDGRRGPSWPGAGASRPDDGVGGAGTAPARGVVAAPAAGIATPGTGGAGRSGLSGSRRVAEAVAAAGTPVGSTPPMDGTDGIVGTVVPVGLLCAGTPGRNQGGRAWHHVSGPAK